MFFKSKIKKEIIEVCKRLHSRNLLAAADGNVSYRLSDEKILITPSGKMKAFMEKKDISLLNLKGEVLKGNPSSEKIMHLEVYKNSKKAKAVIHAHPPFAIAWSVARPELKYLPENSLSEGILACGKIPILEYARPGTDQIIPILKKHLPQSKCMILSRHGALSFGEDLDEAYRGMERIEHLAQILFLSQKLGGLSELSSHEISALLEMRKKIGNKTL